MSKPINDGGPASPVPPGCNMGDGTRSLYGSCGKSLRDWFAGQAIAGGLIAHLHGKGEVDGGWDDFIEVVGKCAYDIADAMIAVKERTEQGDDPITKHIEVGIVYQMRQELARCVRLLDTECCMPDGSNADTLKAHMILASLQGTEAS